MSKNRDVGWNLTSNPYNPTCYIQSPDSGDLLDGVVKVYLNPKWFPAFTL